MCSHISTALHLDRPLLMWRNFRCLCKTLLNVFVAFPPTPNHLHGSPATPGICSREFCRSPDWPWQVSWPTLCMDSMKKLAKKTLCAAEPFPEGGLLGFSSYLLNQLLFWLTCWPLEGLCCESNLAWCYCRDTNPCPVVASIPASSWLLPDLICWLSSSVPCLTLLFIQFLFPPPSLIQLRFFILPSVLLLPKPTHLFHFSIPSCF